MWARMASKEGDSVGDLAGGPSPDPYTVEVKPSQTDLITSMVASMRQIMQVHLQIEQTEQAHLEQAEKACLQAAEQVEQTHLLVTQSSEEARCLEVKQSSLGSFRAEI